LVRWCLLVFAASIQPAHTLPSFAAAAWLISPLLVPPPVAWPFPAAVVDSAPQFLNVRQYFRDHHSLPFAITESAHSAGLEWLQNYGQTRLNHPPNSSPEG